MIFYLCNWVYRIHKEAGVIVSVTLLRVPKLVTPIKSINHVTEHRRLRLFSRWMFRGRGNFIRKWNAKTLQEPPAQQNPID